MTLSREITEHIIAEYLPGAPAEELDPSYDLLKNGVVTSLELLRLIGWLGDRYAIAFEDLDISPDDFRSVAAIEELVLRFRNAAHSSVSTAAVKEHHDHP